MSRCPRLFPEAADDIMLCWSSVRFSKKRFKQPEMLWQNLKGICKTQ